MDVCGVRENSIKEQKNKNKMETPKPSEQLDQSVARKLAESRQRFEVHVKEKMSHLRIHFEEHLRNMASDRKNNDEPWNKVVYMRDVHNPVTEVPLRLTMDTTYEHWHKAAVSCSTRWTGYITPDGENGVITEDTWSHFLQVVRSTDDEDEDAEVEVWCLHDPQLCQNVNNFEMQYNQVLLQQRHKQEQQNRQHESTEEIEPEEK